MIEPKSQKIFAEIEIRKDSKAFYDDNEILKLIYRDFYQKCVWIKQMYPYNRNTLSTYEIMFNVFGFKDTVLGDIIWATHDSYEESIKFFKDALFGKRNFFGNGEWPIIYWYRYRHNNPEINDCVTYTISR